MLLIGSGIAFRRFVAIALSVASLLSFGPAGVAAMDDGSAGLLPVQLSDEPKSAADFSAVMNGPGPITVFAPVNAAFDALPDGTMERLQAEGAEDELATLLAYHVIEGALHTDDIKAHIKKNGGAYIARTLEGSALVFLMDGAGLVVIDAQGSKANITTADIEQANGVIHVIDAVLMPDM